MNVLNDGQKYRRAILRSAGLFAWSITMLLVGAYIGITAYSHASTNIDAWEALYQLDKLNSGEIEFLKSLKGAEADAAVKLSAKYGGRFYVRIFPESWEIHESGMVEEAYAKWRTERDGQFQAPSGDSRSSR